MDKVILEEQINQYENALYNLSLKAARAKDFDSISGFLEDVLTNDIDLAKSLLIPTEAKVRQAILTLIGTNSSITGPFVTMLSTRISTLNAAIYDIKKHEMSGPKIAAAVDNLEPFISLLNKYDFYSEQVKTVETVADALKDGRLHVYKTSSFDPDIRVVLKTLMFDNNREAVEDVKCLIDFLFGQLKENKDKSGFISLPHHAWWALLGVISESTSTWLNENAAELETILNKLLDEREYRPQMLDQTSVSPELNSVFYEKIWVTIDMIRLIRCDIGSIFSASVIDKLKSKTNTNLRSLINGQNDHSIRSIQCMLLVLYEAARHFNYLNAVKIASMSEIDIRENYIGEYIYSDEVKNAFGSIAETITSFFKNRNSWGKHALTSMLISGNPGQGKTEIAIQIQAEIRKWAEQYGYEYKNSHITIGTEIRSGDDLQAFLNKSFVEKTNEKKVHVITFDEFDKADFDFYAPFLKALESKVTDDLPLMIWIFAQSTYSTFKELNSYASSLPNKAFRDFLTRIQLGTIDLPDMKSSSQQKIYSAIGIALKNKKINKITSDCIMYLNDDDSIKNIRVLLKVMGRDIDSSTDTIKVNAKLNTINGESTAIKIVKND